jgi:hypothetical protein
VSTDREVLADLLFAVDAMPPTMRPRPLTLAADAARRHLLLTDAPDGDCARRIRAAQDASYAAGRAREAGARPDRRQGHP